MREIFLFDPIYRERVWGGRTLESQLGRKLPEKRRIGESWDVVDRENAQSVVRTGPEKGRTLRELIETRCAEVMGPKWTADRRFPILVKWLDCRERLSLQVHPPASVAEKEGGEPKTENWFIAETAPGAQLFAGLRRGVTRERFTTALADGSLEECVHRFPVKAGDSFFVPSGRLHAIDGGNLILEIQQNSDTTWRVHDWGRMGMDGRPREIHMKEALESILWDDFEPAPVRAAPTSGVLADCPEFLIRRIVLARGERLTVEGGEQARLLSVVGGRIHAGAATLSHGDTALLPYTGSYGFLAADSALVLLTENFSD